MDKTEFLLSRLEDEQVKILFYYSDLAAGQGGRGEETISYLNVYKYILFFSW